MDDKTAKKLLFAPFDDVLYPLSLGAVTRCEKDSSLALL